MFSRILFRKKTMSIISDEDKLGKRLSLRMAADGEQFL